MGRAIAVCTAAEIKLDVDVRLIDRCCAYSSGRKATPDYDAADASVAL